MSDKQFVCVTGASGYAGTAIVREARKRGLSVCGTYFRHPIPGPEFHRLDIRDADAVASLFRSLHPSVVIHTAADWTTEKAMREVIVEGTRNVASAAADMGIRLIHLSTDVIFDGERGCYTEEDEPAPVHAYGRAKVEAEKIVQEVCDDFVVARTSLIIGLDWEDAQSRWVRDAILNNRPITLFVDEVRSPIWVDDLARALLDIAEADYRGILHVAGPQGLTRYQLGIFLAMMQNLETLKLVPGMAKKSGVTRPLDCTLKIAKARKIIGFSPRLVIPDLEDLDCG